MLALLHQAAMFQHQNLISFLNGGQTVCNHQGGSAPHGRLQGRLNHALTVRIQSAGGFVQQQERWILQHGPRYGNTLPLTTRQTHPTLAQEGVVAIG